MSTHMANQTVSADPAHLLQVLTDPAGGRQHMHLPLLKALVAVISASVLAVGVALSAPPGGAHQPHG